jgi:hypothetical protein
MLLSIQGSTLIKLGDLASGGISQSVIDSSAAAISIAPTASGRIYTLTAPTPELGVDPLTVLKSKEFINEGTFSFTVAGVVVDPSKSTLLNYTGVSWVERGIPTPVSTSDTIQSAASTGITTISAWNSVVLIPTLTGSITLQYPTPVGNVGKKIVEIMVGVPNSFTITRTPAVGSITLKNTGQELAQANGSLTVEAVSPSSIIQISNIGILTNTTSSNRLILKSNGPLTGVLGGVTFTINAADPWTLTTSVAATGSTYSQVVQHTAGVAWDYWMTTTPGPTSLLLRGKNWNSVTSGTLGLVSASYSSCCQGHLECNGNTYRITSNSFGATGICSIDMLNSSVYLRTLNNANLNGPNPILQTSLQAAYDAEGGSIAPDVVPAEVNAAANSLASSNYKIYLGQTQWWYTNTVTGISTASWTVFGGNKSNFGAVVPVNHIFTLK